MTISLSDKQSEFHLHDVPSARISATKFSPVSSQFLIASFWDNSVRLYDVVSNKLVAKYLHGGPVLDCCFQDTACVWSGGLDKKVVSFNFELEKGLTVGTHNSPIRCVEYCPILDVVITGSWDKMVKLWDPRSNLPAGTFAQPDKVYAMAVCGYKIIVGTAGRRVLIWDLRNMDHEDQQRESSLKFQTRCIKSFPSEKAYALSSIEGRVAVEYLDPSPAVQKKRYAFKCHRIKDSNGVEEIYPVNAVAFHPIHGTCATGGSDGFVNIWDCVKKKRLTQFHRYPAGIASLSFNPHGTQLAVASSYLYEMQTDEIPPSSISIRKFNDEEIKQM